MITRHDLVSLRNEMLAERMLATMHAAVAPPQHEASCRACIEVIDDVIEFCTRQLGDVAA